MKRKSYMHSIRFGDGTIGSDGRFVGYDTYTDWHLIPASRPTIGMPGVETKFVPIPGLDGSVDLSEFLRSDRPAYGRRTGTFEFYVDNNDYETEEFWMTIYPKIVNILHGKKFKMVLNEDDPDYYWDGRFTVDKFDADDGYHSKVSISYAVQPWKMKIRKYSEGMVWDNFNFEKDYDYDPWTLSHVEVNGVWSLSLNGDGAPYPMEVTGKTGSVVVTFGGETKTVNAGETVEVGHAVYGPNQITISGSGTLSLDWRGGSL